jgi:hypothetical protein
MKTEKPEDVDMLPVGLGKTWISTNHSQNSPRHCVEYFREDSDDSLDDDSYKLIQNYLHSRALQSGFEVAEHVLTFKLYQRCPLPFASINLCLTQKS